MNDFLKRAVIREIDKCTDSIKMNILELAEKAVQFGFLDGNCLVSDNEFLAFEKATGATRDDIREVIHGLERLNNSDPYSSHPSFFLVWEKKWTAEKQLRKKD